MAMQWPPTPGPGQNGRYPNGLVAAPSSASQMSTPIAGAMVASSLTRAMLTWRKVFSISLAISALRGEDRVTTRSTRAE